MLKKIWLLVFFMKICYTNNIENEIFHFLCLKQKYDAHWIGFQKGWLTMNVVFVAKKVTLTDDFKQKAEKKLIKIEKVLQDPTVNVAVTAIKDMAIVELTIKNNN